MLLILPKANQTTGPRLRLFGSASLDHRTQLRTACYPANRSARIALYALLALPGRTNR